MDVFNAVWSFAAELGTGIFANLGSRLFFVYLFATVAIAYLLYLRLPTARKEGFLRFLVPAEFYRSNSTLVDVKLFLLGRVLTGFGFFRIGITVVVVIGVIHFLATVTGMPPSTAPQTSFDILIATIVIVVASDFCTYWIHRIHHEHPALWPFHAVHHSAEVMTPITVYRKHPIYDLFGTIFRGVFVGAVQGVLLFAISGSADLLTLGGANVFYVAFYMMGSNLRHSHIWMGFGPVLSYILISPAQHQVHHSRAALHHNKNYGEIFAVWDFMFGTLYVPQGEEKLEFGLADKRGVALPQPHNTLREAVIQPFQASAKAIRRRLNVSK